MPKSRKNTSNVLEMNKLDYNKKMIKQTKITVVLLFLGILASAQVKLGNNPGIVNANSLFELESTNKGLLLPRVALTSTTSFAPLAAHVSGMTVYNTATTGDVLPGIYSSNGIKWVAVAIQDASATAGGIINTSAQTLGAGAKTFTSDLRVNGVTVGKGAGSMIGNTALGFNTLLANTTGNYNTATGFNALVANTTGINNNAIGTNALMTNITGSSSVALGNDALALSTVSNMTAVGGFALAANTTGLANTALGYNSLKANTTGELNTATGSNALFANTTGSYNTAIGADVLKANTTGTDNTAIGTYALLGNTVGTANTAIGSYALYNNIVGSVNVAIGFGALRFNGGSYNIAMGRYSLQINSGFSNTAIGSHAATQNTTGGNNTVIGESAFSDNTSGSYNTAIGTYSMKSNKTGSNNTSLGYNIDFTNTTNNSTAIGANTSITTSNTIQMGNSAITTAKVQVAWTITSDRRWKSDIKNSDLGLDFIIKLRPVSYLRKNDETKKTEYGFIAQELEETLNKIGVTNAGILSKDGEGMYQVRYNDFIAPMVKAIQEQQTQIEELKALVKQLLAKKQ